MNRKKVTGFDLPNIFYPKVPFDREILEIPEINSCQVEIVEDPILFVLSWNYYIGKINRNNYMSDMMAFDIIFHAKRRT